MKWHYRVDLLRTIASEDDSIKELRKNHGVGCYIRHILGMVFRESNNTGSSWRKLFPDLEDDLHEQQVRNSWHGVHYEKF
jgi:hypothetical protein